MRRDRLAAPLAALALAAPASAAAALRSPAEQQYANPLQQPPVSELAPPAAHELRPPGRGENVFVPPPQTRRAVERGPAPAPEGPAIAPQQSNAPAPGSLENVPAAPVAQALPFTGLSLGVAIAVAAALAACGAAVVRLARRRAD